MKKSHTAPKPNEDNDEFYPPVPTSWGAMLPNVPSSGYGDISFDASESSVGQPRVTRPLTKLDEEMIDLLPKLIPPKSS